MQLEERSQKVYDAPTRISHWVFACPLVATFVIAKTVDNTPS